jgi:hypothetical protein
MCVGGLSVGLEMLLCGRWCLCAFVPFVVSIEGNE